MADKLTPEEQFKFRNMYEILRRQIGLPPLNIGMKEYDYPAWYQVEGRFGRGRGYDVTSDQIHFPTFFKTRGHPTYYRKFTGNYPEEANIPMAAERMMNINEIIKRASQK